MLRNSLLTPTLIVIVGFLTVCPVVMLIVGSFSSGFGTFGDFTTAKYLAAYSDPGMADMLWNTVIFTLGSALLATSLALFLAYLNTRTNLPWKFLFGIISVIPMMIPHILFAASWVLLLNPSNGILNRLLMEAFGLQSSLFNIYSMAGMILVEGLLDLPIAYLIIAPAMSAFDVSLEESSRVCGASSLRTLIRITLPVLVLFYTSLTPYVMPPGARAFSLMSWKHWIQVLNDPVSLLSLRNSLILGFSGATLGVILSIFIAWVIVKVRTAEAGILESLSFLSFSFPGIVIGVGFMLFFVRTPLYGTLWALLIGYIATYLPYGIKPLSSAFIQIHAHLEESSRVCGATPFQTLRRIIVPLLIPGIVSGWILMATMFVRELTLSVVLSRPGTEVLAVQILRFAEDGLWGRLSALGIIMIFISSALVVLASLIGRKLSGMRITG